MLTLPRMVSISPHDGTLTSRGRRVARARLFSILEMGPMEFKAFCWAAKVGPFAPQVAGDPTAKVAKQVFADGVPLVG